MGRNKIRTKIAREADQYGHGALQAYLRHALEDSGGGMTAVSLPHILAAVFVDGLEAGARIATTDITCGRLLIDVLEEGSPPPEGMGDVVRSTIPVAKRLVKVLTPKAKPPEGL